MEAKPATRQKRASAPKQKQKQGDRVKTTIVMDADLDFRLGANAEFQKLDRSTLAAMLIDQGLKAYKFDQHLRAFNESASPTAELNCAG